VLIVLAEVTQSMIRQMAVYGLGAIGSNLLVQLAKQKPDLLYAGYDFDKVEPRNIGPQAYQLEHVGKPKTVAMQMLLQRYLRSAKFTAHNARVNTAPLHPEDTLVLDCFDNSASRRLLTLSPHTCHVGFSPFYTAEGIWSPSYEVPGDVASDAPDLCTLPDATSFINFVVSTAALNLIRFLITGEKRNFIITPRNSVPTVTWL